MPSTAASTSAWIQLGGLRVGKDGSAFDTFTGYAGKVLGNILVPYGDFDANVAQYYFDAGTSFSAVVSLEQGAGVVGTLDSHVPHVVVGVKQTQGWGAITGVIAHDSNYEALAGKVRVDVNVTDDLSLFGMFGTAPSATSTMTRPMQSPLMVAASTKFWAATGLSGPAPLTCSTRKPRSTFRSRVISSGTLVWLQTSPIWSFRV